MSYARDKRPLFGDGNYTKIFIIAAIVTIIFFLPHVILNKGIFLYYGDYNVQQVPFWKLCHEAVRSGDIWWNWNTDLGSPFIGAYSFYVIGSPFFWITLPFPSSWIPYMMFPLFVLKFSVSAVTAYAYIKRFVKNPDYAVIGGLLYAFSSFSIHNIFFNHFHDVIALFPLMLIGIEELAVKGRKGVFALSVALCAMTNYFFFVGQVIFLIIYFILRCLSPDFKMNLKKFGLLALEAVLGVMLAAVILIPSFMALQGNYRTMEFLTGYDIILYDRVQRYFMIIQSFFMLPDIPSTANYFPGAGSKWASLAGFLPLFSMAGVIAFLKDRKGHWAKRLIIISIVMAFIPVLTSLFFALNWSYYARWFYMPILIMCLATALSAANSRASIKYGVTWCVGITLAFVPIGLLFKQIDKDDVVSQVSITPEPIFVWIGILTGILFVVLLWYIWKNYRRNEKKFINITISTICVLTIFTALVSMFRGNHDFTGNYSAYNEIVVNGLKMRSEIDLPRDDYDFYRIDINNHSVNQPMLWTFPTIHTFHSVVSPSIMNFYPEVNVERDVSSKPDLDKYALRGLFSVKYFFIQQRERDWDKEKERYIHPESGLVGFEHYKNIGNFYIYENMYHVPMGFTYDYYIDKATFESVVSSSRHRLLTKALYLDDAELIEKYSQYIKPHPQIADAEFNDFYGLRTTSLYNTNERYYFEDCDNLQMESGNWFEVTKKGFNSSITLEKPNLVFYSVPYDKGWTAYVNGQEAEVENVAIGFMAVLAEEGENYIEFRYKPRGFNISLILFAAALFITVAYIALFKLYIEKRNPEFARKTHVSDQPQEMIEAEILEREKL